MLGSRYACVRAAFILALTFLGATVVAAQSLPQPWLSADVGSPAVPGSATANSGGFVIEGSGADVWGTADEFHFLYQRVTGDVDVIARINSLGNTDQWAKAGVMIRSSLAAGAAHGFALVSPGRGLAFQRRRADNGISYHTSGGAAGPPRWTRLVRVGTRVTAYVSTDGITWSTVASDTIALGSSAYVGVAVSSHASTLTTASVSQVSVFSSTLPSGFDNADIGSPRPAGAAVYGGGTYRVQAGGADIWNSRDQFHFVYHQVTGDVDIRARVAAVENVHRWTKAGVMIRESLDPASRHGMALVSGSRGYAFHRRTDTAGLSTSSDGGAGGAPGWVRLVRTGSQVDAYRSADGTNWTLISTDVIPMGETVYVGLALTSHLDGTLAEAVFDSVSTTATSPAPNAPPAATLTSPANGASFTAPASVTLTASASDPENALARVEFMANGTRVGAATSAPYSFIWTNVAAGSYALRAVAFDAAGASGTSATVNITVSQPSTPPPTTLPAPYASRDIGGPSPQGSAGYSNGTFTVRAAGADIWGTSDQFHFVYRQMTGDLDVRARVASVEYVHSWTKAGVMIRESLDPRSRHGFSLLSAGEGYSFQRRTATAGVTTSTTGGAGAAPGWVRLVRTGSSISAYRSNDGTNWTLVGTDTIAMAQTVYVGLALGGHVNGTLADAVFNSLSVTTPANSPPSVAITSPASGSVFTAPASTTVASSATDTDGQVARVEFFANGSLIGTDTTSPYAISWSSVPAGSYTLTARAYDDAGAATTSAPANITVSQSAPRLVVFNASADHAAVTRYVLEVFAAGANPATATPVAMSDLGKPAPNASNEITVDRSTFFTALPGGNYIATVRAENSSGFTRSSAISFTR